VRPDDLLAVTLRELVTRAGVDPAQIDDVVAGCVTQTGEQGMNIARAAALIAGFPIEVPGTTINRFCGFGPAGVNFAAQGVMSGAQDIVIGAGVENMSRVPMGSDAFGPGEGPVSPKLMDLFEIIPQGNSAEMIAKKWGFSREQLDEFAYQKPHQGGPGHQGGPLRARDLPGAGEAERQQPRLRRRRGGPDPTVEREDVATQALLPGGWRRDRRQLQPDQRRRRGGPGHDRGKGQELGLKPRARILAQAIVGSELTSMMTESDCSPGSAQKSRAGIRTPVS